MKSGESCWEKSQFALLTDLDPGFGGLWNKLWIFFGTFIMPQKKSFGQKGFWISCTGSKVPFWQFYHSAKIALLNPCLSLKFKIFFWQKTSFEVLWKCHIQKISITCSRVLEIQDLGQSKYKQTFLKKNSWDFKKSFYGSYESLASQFRRFPIFGYSKL